MPNMAVGSHVAHNLNQMAANPRHVPADQTSLLSKPYCYNSSTRKRVRKNDKGLAPSEVTISTS
jgi:hypothetical protein